MFNRRRWHGPSVGRIENPFERVQPEALRRNSKSIDRIEPPFPFVKTICDALKDKRTDQQKLFFGRSVEDVRRVFLFVEDS
jgi:hypothetical protein